MENIFAFLDTARGIVIAMIQLSLAISGMLCIWLAQNIWNAEGWGWHSVLLNHQKGDFKKAASEAEKARQVFHMGWAVAAMGMVFIFLAGVIK